jgi:hypothetical protein
MCHSTPLPGALTTLLRHPMHAGQVGFGVYNWALAPPASVSSTDTASAAEVAAAGNVVDDQGAPSGGCTTDCVQQQAGDGPVSAAAFTQGNVNDPVYRRPIGEQSLPNAFPGISDSRSWPPDPALIVGPHPSLAGATEQPQPHASSHPSAAGMK